MDKRSTTLECNVFDNFLSDDEFKLIQKNIFNENFPWYFSECKIPSDDYNKYNFQFVHMFYYDYSIQSNYFNLLTPLINKLKPKSLIKIKSNLLGCTDKIIEFNKHTDVTFKCKTAVFYINTNNGYTRLSDEKIQSIENRICIFDSLIPHTGSTCTDVSTRCVININYFD